MSRMSMYSSYYHPSLNSEDLMKCKVRYDMTHMVRAYGASPDRKI